MKKSKHLLWILTASLCSLQVWGNTYYPQALKQQITSRSINAQAMRQELHKLLNWYHVASEDGDSLKQNCADREKGCYRQKPLTYKEAREYLFGQLHLGKDSRGYIINDVYCQETYHEGNLDVGPMRIPKHEVLNCEHTWPQSRFTNRYPSDLQKGDLHHLYPSETQANSIRGNYPFGDVANEQNPGALCNTASFGTSNQSSALRFEPPKEHKGNVARSLFYFAVRYEMEIDKEQEAFLRQWHEQDPVDEAEQKRNEGIYAIQKNRNPFIDYPSLVSQISDF